MRLPTTSACALMAASLTIAGCEHPTFPIIPEMTWVQVTAGKEHACVLHESGAAYCWGLNGGQFGNGKSGYGTSLLEGVRPPAGVLFTSLTAGRATTCALTRSATVYCWGSGLYGAIGDGTYETRLRPVPISAPAGITFSAVSAGGDFACALATTGAAYCWGSNLAAPGNLPTLVTAPAGVGFTALSAGYAHTCGLTTARTAYCWGVNTYGVVGDSTTQDRPTPTLVRAPAGVSFVAITAAYEHTCALAASGVTYCWGDNQFGEVGDGSGSLQLTPVAVAAPPGVSFVSIDAGGFHTCGITQSGNVYCWGPEAKVPTLIDPAPDEPFASTDLGDGFACGLTIAGHLRCWGGLVPILATERR